MQGQEIVESILRALLLSDKKKQQKKTLYDDGERNLSHRSAGCLQVERLDKTLTSEGEGLGEGVTKHALIDQLGDTVQNGVLPLWFDADHGSEQKQNRR